MVAGNCLSPVVALNLMSLRAASSFAIGDQHGNRVERLRDLNLLFQQPHAPASLQGAARLHRQLADRGHAIRALAGLPGRTPALGTPATFAEGAPARQRNGIFSPDAYGGDPTGHRDSSAAMDAALGAMARQCQQPGGHLSFNVTNCGGATLDLQAGTYLLTAPLVLPAGGNIRVTGGTLRAAAAFPRDRWLIESNVDCLWHCTPGVDCMFWNTSVLCHEDVTIENVYFDAGHVASGGLLLNNSMGCVISQCYFIGFVRAGIRIQGGHEMVIDQSWLGETWWDEPPPANQSSIGILVDGNDHVVTDTIIFAFTSIGIEVNSPGTIIHNVHVWNGLHKVAGLGPGIHVGPGGATTRISDCYLDNTWLNLVDPSRVAVSGGFFYQANTVLEAGPRSSVAGLVMEGNLYSGPLKSSNVEVAGAFHQSNVSEIELHDEVRLVSLSSPKPTAATSVSLTAQLVEAATTRLEFYGDTSQRKQLLFPWIDMVEYSVTFPAGSGRAGFVRHYSEIADETAVVVHFEEPVNATVLVTVRQAV